MQIHPTATFISPWHPFEIVPAAWRRASGKFHDYRQARRYEQEVSRLPPHLRYDMGALDCRPPQPLPLDQVLSNGQTSLETMWLRYGR